MALSVSVHLLGFHSRAYLGPCLQSVAQQTYQPLEVIFSDNGSADGSVQHVREHFPEVEVLDNGKNLGYCGGHNGGIRASHGDLVITLNPDVSLPPTFVATIVAALQDRPRIGSATGRLRRCRFDVVTQQFDPLVPPVLDSTGLFVDRWRRGVDRDRGRPDPERPDAPELVFAPSGAVAVYRRSMLEAIAENGEYFDETFFVGYEDLDLGWRAQRAGWGCLYVPDAIAYHVRGWGHLVRRSKRPQDRLRATHSLKNRYLMMLKNEAVTEVIRDLPWILTFELAQLLVLAVWQPQVLTGFVWLWRARREALRRRRAGSAGHPALLRQWLGRA